MKYTYIHVILIKKFWPLLSLNPGFVIGYSSFSTLSTEAVSLGSCACSGNGVSGIQVDTQHGRAIAKRKKKARRARNWRKFSNDNEGL